MGVQSTTSQNCQFEVRVARNSVVLVESQYEIHRFLR